MMIDKMIYAKTYDLYILKMGYGFFLNYSYLGIDRSSGFAFVIDPAWNLKKIMDILHSKRATLKFIMLTHSHFDHVNLVDQLVRTLNASVYISQREINYYNYSSINLKPLDDMEEIWIGETRVICLLTPGHTKGGMCYWTEDNIFTGDTVFIEGCGSCFSSGGNPEELYRSIQNIKKIVPAHTQVFPGHSYGNSPGKTLKTLMLQNIYFQLEEQDEFIEFRMRKNQKGLWNFS